LGHALNAAVSPERVLKMLIYFAPVRKLWEISHTSPKGFESLATFLLLWSENYGNFPIPSRKGLKALQHFFPPKAAQHKKALSQ
jgi:hypothetical protein